MSSIYIVLSSFFINILSFALPIAIMQIYDRILVTDGKETLMWLALGVSTSMILEAILRFCRTYSMSLSSLQYDYELTKNMFSKLMSADIKTYNEKPFIFYLDAFKSVRLIKNYYGGGRLQGILDIPFFCMFCAVIFILSFKIGIFLLCSSIVYILLLMLIIREIMNYNVSLEDDESRRTSFVYDSLLKIHQVRVRVSEDYVLHSFNKKQMSLENNEVLSNFFESLPELFSSTFNLVILFGVVGFSSILVINGEMTIGALTACTLLWYQGFWLYKSIC